MDSSGWEAIPADDVDLLTLRRALSRPDCEVLISARGRTTTTKSGWLIESLWDVLDGGDEEDPGPGWFHLSLVVEGLAWDVDVERRGDGSLDLRLASGAILNIWLADD